MADEPMLAEATDQPVEQADIFTSPTEGVASQVQLEASVPADPQALEAANKEIMARMISQLHQLGGMTIQLRNNALRGNDG